MKIRDIKFRAWDEQKKVMHYNFQFVKTGDAGNDWIVFVSDKQDFSAENPRWHDNPYFSQQLKIMQYTGLKDRNGKEIYEGDIVENEYGEKALVEWKTRVSSENWGHGETGFYTFSGFSISSHGTRYVIVGNIFESPEL